MQESLFVSTSSCCRAWLLAKQSVCQRWEAKCSGAIGADGGLRSGGTLASQAVQVMQRREDGVS